MRIALLGIGCLGALVFGCSSSESTTEAAPDSGVAASVDASSDGSSSVDAGPSDPIVGEKPAGECHDLAQQAASIETVADPAPAPEPVPLTSLEPGVYALVSSIEYGTSTVTYASSQRTTVAFTTTKQYYLSETTDTNGTVTSRHTFDWKIVDGKLSRYSRCTTTDPRFLDRTFESPIGASANGFSLFTPAPPPAPSDRIIVVRYERVP